MAEIWHPYDKSVYESWIEAIETEASDELNDWEVKFIDSIKTQLAYNANFSRAQSDKLESIYTKYTR